MRKRIVSFFAVMACGGSFQVMGCDSDRLGEILTSSVRDAAVDLGTFAIESAVDDVLGLDEATSE